jgi:hypothetical protein
MRKRTAAMATAAAAVLSTGLFAGPAQAADRYNMTIYISDGYCLDIPNSSPSDGAVVQQWDCNGTNAQQWNVVYQGSHYFEIQSAAWPQFCLNNWNSGGANGDPIKLFNCSSLDRLFNTVGVDQSNYWEFQPKNASANCVNMWINNQIPRPGDVMRLSPCKPNPTQIFRLFP